MAIDIRKTVATVLPWMKENKTSNTKRDIGTAIVLVNGLLTQDQIRNLLGYTHTNDQYLPKKGMSIVQSSQCHDWSNRIIRDNPAWKENGFLVGGGLGFAGGLLLAGKSNYPKVGAGVAVLGAAAFLNSIRLIGKRGIELHKFRAQCLEKNPEYKETERKHSGPYMRVALNSSAALAASGAIAHQSGVLAGVGAKIASWIHAGVNAGTNVAAAVSTAVFLPFFVPPPERSSDPTM